MPRTEQLERIASNKRHADENAGEDTEGPGAADGGGQRKKTKKEKMQLMGDSGQTAEQRRILRARQRSDKEDFVANRAEIGKLDSDAYEKANAQNNKTFEEVKFTREMVGDSENLKIIAEAAMKQTQELQTGGSLFDPQLIIGALRTMGGVNAGRDFNWLRFGVTVGITMSTVPRITFMNGPIDKPEKVVKPKAPKMKKIVDTDAKQVQPDVVKAGSTKKDAEKDATEKRINVLHGALRKAHAEHPNKEEFHFAEFLINPNSFTQTVENIFDYSFDIKHGKGSLTKDEKTGDLKIKQTLPPNHSDKFDGNRQTVLSFNLQDFHDLIELHDLKGKAPAIPHRTGSDYEDPLLNKGDTREPASDSEAESGAEEAKQGSTSDNDSNSDSDDDVDKTAGAAGSDAPAVAKRSTKAAKAAKA